MVNHSVEVATEICGREVEGDSSGILQWQEAPHAHMMGPLGRVANEKRWQGVRYL